MFTAEQLIAFAYPGVQPDKKHRVAVLRAMRRLADDSARFERYLTPPDKGVVILFNATNVRSLSLGRVFRHFAGAKTIADCQAMLDDPTTDAHAEAQPGGYFEMIARANALWVAGRQDEAEAVDALVADLVAQEKAKRSAAQQPQDNAA